MQANETLSTPSNRSRLTLIFVVICAILPIAASVYLFVTDWRPSTTVNHGELITPARPVTDQALQNLDGEPVSVLDKLQRNWTMIYFGSSACDEACMSNLFRMRQTHIAQGRDSERVQTVFVVADDMVLPTLKSRLADYAQMQVWLADEAAMSKFANDFGMGQTQLLQQQHIYLVDPMGNLFMRYAPDVDPAGLRKDLGRVLTFSGAG
jgi:cytochrome oxidase Cu insertion factor (SCO1/SenC/PrrC family)